MFNINDKITFHIVMYDKNNKQLIPFYNLSKFKNEDFKLPETTSHIELKEYIQSLGIPSLTTIRTYYIGKISTIREILELNKEIVIEIPEKIDSIDDKVLIEEKEKEIRVKRTLSSKDLVFESVEELESYLKKLTVALDSFKQKEEAVKKLLTKE